MALDRKIRSFPIPVHLQPPLQGFENRTWSKDPASAMQQYALIVEREMNLLFLHRNYLAVAIKMQTQNPLAHKFGGSVIATFRSVSRMCLALKDLYYLHPKPISHIWLFWSGIFSACVVFSALVIKSPGCPLAEAALTEFSSACSLFEEGAEPCRHPKAMLLLNHLKRRAEDSYSTYLASPENHAKQLYLGRLAGHMDELNILGGLQGVIRHSSRFSLDSPVSIPSRTSNVRTQLAHEELPVPSNEGAYEGPSSQFTDMPRPFDITTMDCFGLADMGYQDPSPPGLPTYEQIMNADPTQTYTPSWQPSSQAVGHAVPSAESLGVEFTGGGFEQYADAQMTASLTGNEGESIWRSFLEGLMNESPEYPTILQNFPF
ncbi:hypothetical protein PHLCEN_2v11310 [Hermanssonia centrifuga]|uniref:Uncharacterized protein n=1 Tax=Hermanssonia centrifuga TaxID=98765 RepID=A0A2R6NKC5_9APHY|nr:hypothetical protein PHLCEN_2v11310 [Hermanssonia centrifuga]